MTPEHIVYRKWTIYLYASSGPVELEDSPLIVFSGKRSQELQVGDLHYMYLCWKDKDSMVKGVEELIESLKKERDYLLEEGMANRQPRWCFSKKEDEMGKVTVIIESEEINTSDLELMMHEMEFDTIVNADPDVGIYVVPSDEE